MEGQPFFEGPPRRLFAYAIVATLILVGAGWIGRSVAPPYAANAEFRLEIDRSTGDAWPRGPWPGSDEQRFGNLVVSPVFPMRAAEVLEASSPEAVIDLAYIWDRASFTIDPALFRVEIQFSDDRRELARAGADALVTAYQEILTERRGTDGPNWVMSSAAAAVARSDVDPVIVVAYVLGGAALVAFIPRDWWADPVGLTRTAITARWFLAVGVIGGTVFAGADLFGYGYPGLGIVQLVGIIVMAGTALIGMTELMRRRQIAG